jgi:hypothetical protein
MISMPPTLGPWTNIFGTKRCTLLLWQKHTIPSYIETHPSFYFHSRGSADIGGFGEAFNVDLFIPGIASLVNHHSALDNGKSPAMGSDPYCTIIYLSIHPS